MESDVRRRVLVIEDDKETANLLRDLLNGSKHFVCVGRCLRLETGVRKSIELKPDIILFDLVHQKLERHETIVELKQKVPEALVIVFTAFHDTDFIFRALRAGADGYLLKNDCRASLDIRLSDVANNGPAFSPEVALEVLRYFRTQGNALRESSLKTLTQLEVDTLGIVALGNSNQQAADRMGSTMDVIKKRMQSIMRKLNVENRTAAVLIYQNGFIGKKMKRSST